MVGDRGLLTDARIRQELEPTDFGWITALRAPAIRKLLESGDLQLSLFDERDLGEITAPELYPGERVVVCRNPLLAEERKRKRLALMARTGEELDKVVAATLREQRRLKDKDKIAVRADRALRRYKVGKHFETTVTEEGLSWTRNEANIAAEAWELIDMVDAGGNAPQAPRVAAGLPAYPDSYQPFPEYRNGETVVP